MSMGNTRINTAGAATPLPGGASGAWPLTVEMSPESIPATAPIDVEGFLGGDPDPCQVVAKVPAGWSSNGYFFSEAAVRDIAAKIAKEGATAGLGHIEHEGIGYHYPPVAVAWVGALYDEARRCAFVRGYVDPGMPDLKRHIRSQVINRVSTDGYAKMETDTEGRQVLTSFDLVSLDLAPRLRNGTESPIVARDMKHEEVDERLAEEAKDMEKALLEGEAGEALDLLGSAPLRRVRDLLALEDRVARQEQEALLARVVDELVDGEDARPLVAKLAAVKGTGTEARPGREVHDCGDAGGEAFG